ncbi:MAG TPA: DUF1150 family protein [Magnetospirillaceae bacterium]|jgi:hypothetical protein
MDIDNDIATKLLAVDASMSARDFATWGVEDVAYIRFASIDGKKGWAIFAADGSAIGVAAERELAFAAARQNDLEPLSVH